MRKHANPQKGATMNTPINLTTPIPGLKAKKTTFDRSSGNFAPNFYRTTWLEIVKAVEALGLSQDDFYLEYDSNGYRCSLNFKGTQLEAEFPCKGGLDSPIPDPMPHVYGLPKGSTWNDYYAMTPERVHPCWRHTTQ